MILFISHLSDVIIEHWVQQQASSFIQIYFTNMFQQKYIPGNYNNKFAFNNKPLVQSNSASSQLSLLDPCLYDPKALMLKLAFLKYQSQRRQAEYKSKMKSIMGIKNRTNHPRQTKSLESRKKSKESSTQKQKSISKQKRKSIQINFGKKLHKSNKNRFKTQSLSPKNPTPEQRSFQILGLKKPPTQRQGYVPRYEEIQEYKVEKNKKVCSQKLQKLGKLERQEIQSIKNTRTKKNSVFKQTSEDPSPWQTMRKKGKKSHYEDLVFRGEQWV